MIQSELLQFFVQTPTRRYGPYPTQPLAECAILSLGLTDDASVIALTSDGKQVLLG